MDEAQDYSSLIDYSIKLLSSGIYHSEWAVRFATAEILVNFQNSQGTPDLIQGLRHKYPSIRQRAIISLDKLNQRIFFEAISNRLKDEDEEVRGYAIEAIAKYPESSILLEIRKILLEKNPLLHHHCIEVAKNSPDGRNILYEILQNDDEHISYLHKLLAAYYLIKYDESNTLGHKFLLNMLKHKDSWLAFLAAKKLAEVNDKSGVENLLNMLKQGGWTEKISALESLISLGIQDQTISEILYNKDYNDSEDRFLFRPKNEKISQENRVEIINLLHKFHPEQAVLAIKQQFPSSDDVLKARILSILGEWKSLEIFSIAKNIITTGPEHLRIAIIRAVEQANKKDWIFYLTPILKNSHFLVQLQIARVILKLTGQKTVVLE